MAVMSNPRLIGELEHFGAADVVKCYHCGNCSAACPFSKEPFIFPRKSMRYLQTGLEDKLRGTLEPWLCYYCGECSDQCPRGAEPGETMMSLRRWLTAHYDITGLSRLLYRSWKNEAIFLTSLALGVGMALATFGLRNGNIQIYSGPGAFLPVEAIHIFDNALAALLLSLLALSAFRMWWLTTGRDRTLHIPLLTYIQKAWLIPVHLFTQKRYGECDRKIPWSLHLILVLSYLTMFTLVVFFLEALQSGPSIRWAAHIPGYLATLGLLGSALYFLQQRIKKTQAQYRNTHHSDWIFLGLLIFVVTTGLAQHLVHRLGLPVGANLLYLVHLMGVACWSSRVLSKWSHLLLRPLAMYFAEVQAESIVARQRNRRLLPKTAPGAQPA